jgi:very-short-patch-repair endonuclease
MRKRQSEMVKERYRRNPSLHPNRRLAGNFSKMTYPETVAFNWFTGKGITFTHNEKVGKYFPDFLIGSVIIEIDGERWHPEGSEKDASRDADLAAMGFTVHRIRSSECIEDRLAQIFNEGLEPKSYRPRPKGVKTPKSVKPLSPLRPPLPKEKVEAMFTSVEDAGIDINTWGWKTKVAKLWGFSHTHVKRLYDRYWKGPKPLSRGKRVKE